MRHATRATRPGALFARYCLSLALLPPPCHATAPRPPQAGSGAAPNVQNGKTQGVVRTHSGCSGAGWGRAERGRAPWQPPGPVAVQPALQRGLAHVGREEEAPPGGGEGVLELDVAEARKLASQMRRARQLRMSFGDDAAGVRETPAEPVMLKVFIDQEVRTLLKLAARERRGRVVLDAADPTLTGLIAALEARFPIGAVPYRLQARWQRRAAPLPAPHEAGHGQAGRLRESVSVDDDAAVARLLDLVSSEDAAIRLELHVLMSSRTLVKGEQASPGLQALIAASVEWCMVSLYAFTPMPDAVAVAELLQREWGRMGILGRTYVAAAEGINAQLAVPDQVLPALEGQVHAVAALQYARLNVDARREPMRLANGAPGRPPFHGLHVRVRPQIVADGLPPSSGGWRVPYMSVLCVCLMCLPYMHVRVRPQIVADGLPPSARDGRTGMCGCIYRGMHTHTHTHTHR